MINVFGSLGAEPRAYIDYGARAGLKPQYGVGPQASGVAPHAKAHRTFQVSVLINRRFLIAEYTLTAPNAAAAHKKAMNTPLQPTAAPDYQNQNLLKHVYGKTPAQLEAAGTQVTVSIQLLKGFTLSGVEDGSLGDAAALVLVQGGVQHLSSSANQALTQALASRYPVLTSSASMGAGGMTPGHTPNADYYGFVARLTGSGESALAQAKTAPVLLVDTASFDKILSGGTGDLVYVVAKDMTVATALAQAGASLAIANVKGGAAAGATDEKKPMSTAGKVAVGAAILGAGWFVVKQLGKPSASATPTVRSY